MATDKANPQVKSSSVDVSSRASDAQAAETAQPACTAPSTCAEDDRTPRNRADGAERDEDVGLKGQLMFPSDPKAAETRDELGMVDEVAARLGVVAGSQGRSGDENSEGD